MSELAFGIIQENSACPVSSMKGGGVTCPKTLHSQHERSSKKREREKDVTCSPHEYKPTSISIDEFVVIYAFSHTASLTTRMSELTICRSTKDRHQHSDPANGWSRFTAAVPIRSVAKSDDNLGLVR